MRKLLFVILLFTLTPKVSISQIDYFTMYGVAEYVDSFVEKYGLEDFNKRIESLKLLSNDSLSQVLKEDAYLINFLKNIAKKGIEAGAISEYKYDSILLEGVLAYSILLNRNMECRKTYAYGAFVKEGCSLYVSAIRDYTKALKFYDSMEEFDDYSIKGRRGEAKCKIKDYYGAIDDITYSLIKTRDNLPSSLDEESYYVLELQVRLIERGRAYLMLNKFDLALKDFSEYLNCFVDGSKRSEAYGECFYLRGLVYISMNNKELGCKDFSKSGELGYENPYNLIREFCN